MSKQEFSRKELYELVWSKPLSTLAKEFLISDNGLRKICKKHNIPLPKIGHWQKVLYGKRLRIIQLPVDDKMVDAKISLDERGTNEDKKYHFQAKLSCLIKEIQEDDSLSLEVPEKLSRFDKLVKEAKEELRVKKKSTYGIHQGIVLTPHNTIGIAVAPGNIRRALRFMDALIKLIRARGHSIEVHGRDTFLIIHDEKFKVRCREKLKRIIKENSRWSWDRTETIPSGLLTFQIDVPYNPKIWQDDKKPIEDKLARILAWLEIKAEEEKIQRIERERWWREQERERQLELKQKDDREWEEKKVRMLLENANQWDQSRNLTAFIEEIENRRRGMLPKDSFEEWIKWAKNIVTTVDPLSSGVDKFIENYKTPHTA